MGGGGEGSCRPPGTNIPISHSSIQPPNQIPIYSRIWKSGANLYSHLDSQIKSIYCCSIQHILYTYIYICCIMNTVCTLGVIWKFAFAPPRPFLRYRVKFRGKLKSCTFKKFWPLCRIFQNFTPISELLPNIPIMCRHFPRFF